MTSVSAAEGHWFKEDTALEEARSCWLWVKQVTEVDGIAAQIKPRSQTDWFSQGA
jgi:hypothetical protein